MTAKKLWINVRNGSKYIVVNDEVHNCTNFQEGQRMVLYHPSDKPESLYVRSYDEFLIKFVPDHSKQ